MQKQMIRVVALPSDPVLLKRVELLTQQAVRLSAKSASARPYESLEYHIVHWKLPWAKATDAMRAISQRVAAIVDTVVLDDVKENGGRPFGDALAALPLDVVTCEEALALQDVGFHFEVAIRYWPGVNGAAQYDPEARLASTRKRAGKKAFTYYCSTGDAFIYSRPLPRSLR